MQPFTLERPSSLRQAAQLAADGAEFIAGGTDMVQLMKEWVRTPRRLVDLDPLLDQRIEVGPRSIRIGAGAKMEQVATDPDVARLLPMLSEALLQSASPQVRNLATMGGNLLQRTRCGYFRDVGEAACNKRRPGSGCAAIGGENRIHAVFGTTAACIAAHPSDLAVALVALDASLHLTGLQGERKIGVAELYLSSADHPEQESTLLPGEIITDIEIPLSGRRQSCYLKVRDRAAFEWALLSAAVALEIADDVVREARIAMGGVGPSPWRMANVEAALQGQRPDPAHFAAAASRATEAAVAYGRNAYKLTLIPKILTRALTMAGDAA